MRVRDTRASRVVQEDLDSDGGVKASGPGDEVYGERDFDRVEQYGLASEPPDGTEYIRIPGDPLPMGHERPARPSGVPGIGSGQTVLYGPDGESYVYLNDNVDAIPKSGSKVRLGGTTGTSAVAYAFITEALASDVACDTAQAVINANLLADLNKIKADLLALWNAVLNLQGVHGITPPAGAPLGGGTAPSFSAASYVPPTVNQVVGFVKTGSDNVEVKR
jgi:phage gp45-like